MVLPQAQAAVPSVLHAEEVPVFLDLERALGPRIHDLGDAPDDNAYTSDPRWARLWMRAQAALVVMQRLDEGTSS